MHTYFRSSLYCELWSTIKRKKLYNNKHTTYYTLKRARAFILPLYDITTTTAAGCVNKSIALSIAYTYCILHFMCWSVVRVKSANIIKSLRSRESFTIKTHSMQNEKFYYSHNIRILAPTQCRRISSIKQLHTIPICLHIIIIDVRTQLLQSLGIIACGGAGLLCLPSYTYMEQTFDVLLFVITPLFFANNTENCEWHKVLFNFCLL